MWNIGYVQCYDIIISGGVGGQGGVKGGEKQEWRRKDGACTSISCKVVQEMSNSLTQKNTLNLNN